MKSTSIGVMAASAVLALTLASCSSSSSSSDGSGKFVIGTKFDQPGLGLKEGDKMTGLDVDVATYVAGKLGHKPEDIEWKQAPSKQREQLIKSGQVDMIAATYSITDERKKEVSFAGPYFIATQALMIRKGEDIGNVADLAGKKLCSVAGSTSATKLKEQQPKVALQEFDTYSKCAEALLNKTVDAMTTDDTILSGFANQAAYQGKFEVIQGIGGEEPYGVGIKKGDTELCTKINTAITEMISDGSWEKFVKADLGDDYSIDAKLNPPTPATCS